MNKVTSEPKSPVFFRVNFPRRGHANVSDVARIAQENLAFAKAPVILTANNSFMIAPPCTNTEETQKATAKVCQEIFRRCGNNFGKAQKVYSECQIDPMHHYLTVGQIQAVQQMLGE